MEEYIRHLEERVKAGTLDDHPIRLIFQGSLGSVEAISQVQAELHEWRIEELEVSTQHCVHLYLAAKYCDLVAHLNYQALTAAVAEKYCTFYLTICKYESNHDFLKYDFEAFLNNLDTSIRTCPQGKELFRLLNVIVGLLRAGREIQQIIKTACIRLLESLQGFRKESLDVLRASANLLQELDPDSRFDRDADYNELKLQAVATVLTHLYQDDFPAALGVELLKWIGSSRLDAELLLVVVDLRTTFAKKQAVDPAFLFPIRHPEQPLATFQIMNIDQLNIEKYPVYSCRLTQPQFFVYHASLNCMDGSLPLTVKEYVSAVPETIENYFKEGGRTKRLKDKDSSMLGTHKMLRNGLLMQQLKRDGGCRYGGKQYLSIITERCTYSLMEKLCEMKQAHQQFERTELFELAKRLVYILQVLHLEDIRHLNLNPHKVYYTERGSLVTADFAVAPQYRENPYTSTPMQCDIQGHTGYMPPELAGGCDDPAVDVYQLGLTLLQAATLREVASVDSREEALKHVVHPWLENLLQRMLSPNSSDRLSLDEVSQYLLNLQSS